MMGNAVRLANKDADRSKGASQPVFSVPRGGNSFVTNSTVLSGKKIQMSEKGESSKVKYWPSVLSSEFSYKPSTETHGTMIMADYKKSNFNETKSSSLFATAGQKTVEKIENSRQTVFLQGEKPQTSSETPKAEVRYIVLQPGQKMSDLLPLTSGQESGQNANQPHLVYLGQLKAPPTSMGVLHQPPNPQFTRSDIPLPHPVESGPSVDPPVHASDSGNDLPIPNNRPKDVVPGTEDRYRTPGSSFLNKKGNIKRPMNAFMVWARNYRSKLASRYHGDTNSQISIKLGDVWNSLTPEEKQPFYEEAERIKNQHRKEFPGWVYRPTITKKRQEEPDAQQAHQMLWARFAGGSSSATLAAMATAAANQTPLQAIRAKPELLPLVAVKKEVSMDSNPNEPQSETLQPTNAQEQAEEKKTSVEQTILDGDKEGQTKDQASFNTEPKLQKPTMSTQEVLKAKLCSQSLPKPRIPKDKAASGPRTSISQSKNQKNSAKPNDQEQSLKGSKERVPLGQQGKKKKMTVSKGSAVSQSLPGIERKEGTQYKLDLRPRSPVTPPSSPRTSGMTNGYEDPVTVVEILNKVSSQLGTGSQSAPDWRDVTSSAHDKLVRCLIQPEFTPFTPLSPRDVPSDEILGTGRRPRRFSESEDLSRPERVTSDIYLDLDSWSSYLMSSESASNLTDDDVCKMFDPKKCKHGEACTVCTSDIDLAPKPVRETLQERRDHAQSSQEVVLAQCDNQQVDIKGVNSLLSDPSVCVEVDVVERKPEKSDNTVDEITTSVYKALMESCGAQRTFNKPSTDSRAENMSPGITCSEVTEIREQDQAGSSGEVSKRSVEQHLLSCAGSYRRLEISESRCNISETDKQNSGYTVNTPVCDSGTTNSSMEKLGESCESEEASVAMDADSELDNHSEFHRVKFMDVSLSMDKSTHVVFKGGHSGKTVYEEFGAKPSGCSTCIGCWLDNHQGMQNEPNKTAHISAAPVDKRSGCFEHSARGSVCRTGAPTIVRPTSKQVLKTDNSRSDDSDSTLAPEVIALSRSMDPESRSRCEMYHRQMPVPRDISKYKIFNKNRSAKSGGRRLKSVQKVLNVDSLNLGVEIIGESISCGNMPEQPVQMWKPVEIDELDNVEGTGIQIESRCEAPTKNKSKTLSPGKSGSLPEGGRHLRGRKKIGQSPVKRVSDGAESDKCHGDSAKGSSDSNPESPGSQMGLLKTILDRQRERERGCKDAGGFSTNRSDQFAGSRYRKSRMRSHITSKIYAARQTLPELPKKKSNGRGRSARSKITRTDHL